MKEKRNIIITGAIVGIISVLLVKFGNPMNMGFCIACFIRDIAGGIGMHRAPIVQYIRPEIIGLVLGAFIISMKNKEFQAKGGSSPFTRFVLGIVVMIGALMFLGCPLRMVLRLAGGDLNAILGIVGFVVGIFVGVFFLNKGFNLKRSYNLPKFEGYLFPIVNVGLFLLLLSGFSMLIFSEEGPGSMHAPIWIALFAGLIVGILAQKTRLCMVGGTRDMIMFKDNYLLAGFLAILVFAFIGNLIFGYFNPSFADQPVAHTDGLWNFLGMALVGWGSVLLGGCPLRQLILAGEGNADSSVTVMGSLVGAAIAHNFGLASSPAGATNNGKIAVLICFVLVLVVSLVNSEMLVNKKTLGKSKNC
ncbi:YedE family putative selenium transporter [Clostridium sp. Cult1]|uniref:YedE family putative selenium transporter n=1 Tax=Clostridium sp. Cult1 TaxID=2079002 RepID=UPI001F28B812|nr:YedE family putative selenium transporter [Clostridium sp. Cult1]MCF6462866.1 YedE-related selenium metabolism membrane protein [Clostridium sp. Cult1]